eukprot:SAG22_NODE_843_length_6889_cov_61.521649_5_plen_93_part_00
MRAVLSKNPVAQYIGWNQDDGLWAREPELLNAPIQSLYHRRKIPVACNQGPCPVDVKRYECYVAGACRCMLGCGLVSMVFRRDLLEQFLCGE